VKLVTFTKGSPETNSIGAIVGADVLDLHLASGKKLPNEMLSFISGGDELLKIANHLITTPSKEALIPFDKVRLKAPILLPPSLKDFFAFEEHAKAGAARRKETLATEWYELPAYYKGNHRQILGPEDEIPWPFYTRKLDFECEIACIIGKKGKNISVSEAENYIFGYMIFNDVSARDIQKKEMILRMGPSKSKDFANVFGPYLVTKDEINPTTDLSLTVKINGEVWSKGHFKDQYWGFPLMVSHISQEEMIYPGDVLGSGTFYKGCGLDLDRWIKPGDVIELEVPKLGTLRNRVGNPSGSKELIYKKQQVAT